MVPPVINPCVLSCCNKILQRTKRNHCTRARPILYKTALFSILSPDSPVFLVDLIHSRDHERSIYISLYTISYRHDIESKWIERFLKLIKLGDECEHATEIDTVIDPGDRAVLLTRVRLYTVLSNPFVILGSHSLRSSSGICDISRLQR